MKLPGRKIRTVLRHVEQTLFYNVSTHQLLVSVGFINVTPTTTLSCAFDHTVQYDPGTLQAKALNAKLFCRIRLLDCSQESPCLLSAAAGGHRVCFEDSE